MKHLLAIEDLSAVEVEAFIERAQMFVDGEKPQTNFFRECFVSNLFFENSTRTRFSFEVAQKKLGVQVLNFQDSTSSTQKGESIYDTLKSLEAMGVQAAIIRHAQNGLLNELQADVGLSLINAGTGNEEHPTQGLLDLLTMKQEFSSLQGLNVAIVGDVQHSRVARSNYYGLKKLGARVMFAGPDIFRPQNEPLNTGSEWLPMGEAIRQADVVMMLRVQCERHAGQLAMDPDTYFSRYGLTEEKAHWLQPHAIIMHPGPVNRGVEIASSLIESAQSRIFQQMQNGVAVRMAVLERVLSAQMKPLSASYSVL